MARWSNWTSAKKQCEDDSASETITELNSAIAELDAMSVDSEAECACKYYAVKSSISYDLNGAVQTQKWAKRMRQKEQN